MTKNFNQKGFTANFLSFMKDLERNKLCCLDFLTQIYTQNSDTISFTGLGTKSNPLIANSSSGNADNGLTINGGFTQLGQVLNASGNPASLLHNSEIPLAGFTLGIKANAGRLAANPLLKFTDSTGTSLIDISSDDVSNLFIGANAGAANIADSGDFQGISNTAIGSNNLKLNVSGSFNVAIGYNSMPSLNGDGTGTGNNNIGIGAQTLFLTTTGFENTAIGGNTLYSISTGFGNTGVGTNVASNFLSIGSYNTAIGDNALSNIEGSQNVAIGTSALGATVSGASSAISSSFNTVIGSGAAQQGAIGNLNIVIGWQASFDDGLGVNNIIIGASTSAGSANNTILLGYGLSTTLSNIAVIGRGDQNVIIGSTATVVDIGSVLQIRASGTTGGQINLAISTAPTTLNEGDIWYDGTNLKMVIGGVVKTFTLV